MLAVVGADGAGKTTYCNTLGKTVIHAIPKTRWKAFGSGYLREILMGFEKTWVFLKIRFMRDKERIVLDRCYIDALVYSLFWARRYHRMGLFRVAKFFNILAPQPDIIYQLEPDPTLARPKRAYTPKDIDELNKLYVSILFTEGYQQIDYTDYDFGLIRIWTLRKDENGKGI